MSTETRITNEIVAGKGVSQQTVEYAQALLEESAAMFPIGGQLTQNTAFSLLPNEWVTGNPRQNASGESTGK